MQRAVACVSRAVVIQGRPSANALSFLALSEDLAPLRGRPRLALSFLHSFALRPLEADPSTSVVRSAAYFYQLHQQDGTEVIAFHWHPGRLGRVPFAHLHVESRIGPGLIERKRHVPSGRVPFEAVVRFAIEELGVSPLRGDWQRVLHSGVAAFDLGRWW